MKRSSVALRMMSLIAATAFAGCGGGGSDTSSTAATPTAGAPAPSPSPSPAPSPAPAPAPAAAPAPAPTGVALRGKSLWTDLPNTDLSCDGCHGPAPLSTTAQRAAAGWEVIASAIQNNRGGMGALTGKLTGQDMRDLSAYLATPNI